MGIALRFCVRCAFLRIAIFIGFIALFGQMHVRKGRLPQRCGKKIVGYPSDFLCGSRFYFQLDSLTRPADKKEELFYGIAEGRTNGN